VELGKEHLIILFKLIHFGDQRRLTKGIGNNNFIIMQRHPNFLKHRKSIIFRKLYLTLPHLFNTEMFVKSLDSGSIGLENVFNLKGPQVVISETLPLHRQDGVGQDALLDQLLDGFSD
jgi:hypothetical protein